MGYWQGPRSLEVGEEGDYIPIATLSPPEWFLHYDGQWWETVLMVHLLWGAESQKRVSTNHNFLREGSRTFLLLYFFFFFLSSFFSHFSSSDLLCLRSSRSRYNASAINCLLFFILSSTLRPKIKTCQEKAESPSRGSNRGSPLTSLKALPLGQSGSQPRFYSHLDPSWK